MGLLEYLEKIAKQFEEKVTTFTDEWWNEIFPKTPEKIVDTDLDELLEEEAPAAGAQGGLGHNFVRNARILEEVNPPGFEFPGTARDVGEVKTGKAIKDSITEEYLEELYNDSMPTPPIVPDEPIPDNEPPVEPDEDDDTPDPEIPPEPPIDDEDKDDDDEDQDDEPDDDEDEDNPPPPPDDEENDDDDDQDEVDEDDDDENPPDEDEDDNPDDDNEDHEDDEENDEDEDDEEDDDDENEDPDDEDDDPDDDDEEDEDDDPPDDDDELTGQNPGNDKEVGNSQWDGETGASGKEGKGKHQDGIDTDENQPGGKEKGQNLTEGDLLYDTSSNSQENYFIDLDVKNSIPPSYDNSYDL